MTVPEPLIIQNKSYTLPDNMSRNDTLYSIFRNNGSKTFIMQCQTYVREAIVILHTHIFGKQSMKLGLIIF